jgi:hypothetical protein
MGKTSEIAVTENPSTTREKTTWGEVCSQVGFSDNLYRTCRDKLGASFTPAAPFGFNGMEDGEEPFGEDFDKQLRSSAQPVPPPPPEGWEPEPEGFMEQILNGDMNGKLLLYGGGAIALWLLVTRLKTSPSASKP